MENGKFQSVEFFLNAAEDHLKEAEKLKREFTADIRAFHRTKALQAIQAAKLIIWAQKTEEDYHGAEAAEAIDEAIALLKAAQDLDVQHNEQSLILQRTGLARALALLEGVRQSDGGVRSDSILNSQFIPLPQSRRYSA